MTGRTFFMSELYHLFHCLEDAVDGFLTCYAILRTKIAPTNIPTMEAIRSIETTTQNNIFWSVIKKEKNALFRVLTRNMFKLGETQRVSGYGNFQKPCSLHLKTARRVHYTNFWGKFEDYFVGGWSMPTLFPSVSVNETYVPTP